MIDLTGQKFGRLTALERIGVSASGNAIWLCRCNCGSDVSIPSNNLKNGHTKSCGCLQKEELITRLTQHGHSKKGKVSKTYHAWQDMLGRCTNLKNPGYHNYGGRGITICKRWFKFENFLKNMGEVPEGHQIDRIDNNGNYCKSNCQWVTSKINNRNRRNNHLITYDGKTQCMIEWAEKFNIHIGTLWSRLSRGWSIEKALTTPVQKNGL